ncbi:choice-of-anchor D domain-containing protein [Umezawaea sp. Da 62-37]|uniref:choice-of-anchor D domain-containing protein n=1 Tax=Umezawaea sp. Da 62-37 TaxID=3075927 RepID=UPI0028F742A4|nr:choice-of-anchor D domain-containing protein [Umezawaea sp. Da 62-37]WNV87958.1 choice-of-anchor D domain-containing protein [Umezawaea sp. Da 62-37]
MSSRSRRRAAAHLALVSVLVLAVLPGSGVAQGAVAPGGTTRVSQDQNGGQWTGASTEPAVTPDGRYAVFLTTQNADPLDNSPTSQTDAYAVDRRTGKTSLVGIANASPVGTVDPGNGQSVFGASTTRVSVSDDGRYVAVLTNAVGVDAQQSPPAGVDVYLCDRDTDNDGVYDEFDAALNRRETYCTYVGDPNALSAPSDPTATRATEPKVSGDGSVVVWVAPGKGGSMRAVGLTRDQTGRVQPPAAADFADYAGSLGFTHWPTTSRDGDYVVVSADYTEDSPPGAVFGYTPATGQLERVDVGPDGQWLKGTLVDRRVAVSADGMTIAFDWRDTGTDTQVYVVDLDPDDDGVRWTQNNGEPFRSTLVSRKTDGTPGTGGSPSLSADGRYVAFLTAAAGMHDGADLGDAPPCGYPGLSDDSLTTCQVVVRDVVVDVQREADGLGRLPAALASVQAVCGGPPQCGTLLPNYLPALTGTGAEVLFQSSESTLAGSDTNGVADVYSRRFTPSAGVAGGALPDTVVGAASSVVATVSHTGFGPLPLGQPVVTGPDAGDFALEQNQTCAGTTLYETGQCLVTVRFTPTASGNRTATLSLRDPGGAEIATYGLNAVGVAPDQPTPTPTPTGEPDQPNPDQPQPEEPQPDEPQPDQPEDPAAAGVLAVDDAQAAFGESPVGATSPPRTLVFTNRGGQPLDLTGASLLPTLPGGTAYPGDYAVTSDGCAARVLEAGESCAVSVTHTPAGAGRRDALLRVTTADGQAPALLLTGAGVAVSLAVSPAVTRPGRVVLVTATGLPANTAVSVVLAPDGLTVPARTDAAGRFTASYPVGREAETGVFPVQVRSTTGQVLASTSLLVATTTAKPPDFAGR